MVSRAPLSLTPGLGSGYPYRCVEHHRRGYGRAIRTISRRLVNHCRIRANPLGLRIRANCESASQHSSALYDYMLLGCVTDLGCIFKQLLGRFGAFPSDRRASAWLANPCELRIRITVCIRLHTKTGSSSAWTKQPWGRRAGWRVACHCISPETT